MNYTTLYMLGVLILHKLQRGLKMIIVNYASYQPNSKNADQIHDHLSTLLHPSFLIIPHK